MPSADHTPNRDAGDWRLIRHYAYTGGRFEDVWPLLASSPAAVLGGEEAAGSGTTGITLRVRRGGVELSREVRLRFGGLVCEERRARLALRWEDARHPRLFPVLDAVLEFVPVDSGHHQVTQVGLIGRYRPPGGVVGGLADRVAGEDIAADAVAGFVSEVAHRLEAMTHAGAAEAPPGDDPPEAPPGHRRVFLPLDRLDDQPGGAACVGRYLQAVPGVLRAEVHPLDGLAAVEYDPELCNPVQLMEELEDDREWCRDEPPPGPGEAQAGPGG